MEAVTKATCLVRLRLRVRVRVGVGVRVGFGVRVRVTKADDVPLERLHGVTHGHW